MPVRQRSVPNAAADDADVPEDLNELLSKLTQVQRQLNQRGEHLTTAGRRTLRPLPAGRPNEAKAGKPKTGLERILRRKTAVSNQL